MSIERCTICNLEIDTDIDDSGTYLDEDFWCEPCYENNKWETRQLLEGIDDL